MKNFTWISPSVSPSHPPACHYHVLGEEALPLLVVRKGLSPFEEGLLSLLPSCLSPGRAVEALAKCVGCLKKTLLCLVYRTQASLKQTNNG